jgi:hypothetical protein
VQHFQIISRAGLSNLTCAGAFGTEVVQGLSESSIDLKFERLSKLPCVQKLGRVVCSAGLIVLSGTFSETIMRSWYLS